MEGINSVKGEIHNVLTVLRLEGRVSSGRRNIRRGSSAGTQGGFSFFFGARKYEGLMFVEFLPVRTLLSTLLLHYICFT